MTQWSSQQKRALQALSIERWVPVEGDGTRGDAANVREVDDDPDSLEKIEREVSSCTRCELHQHRTHTVFGAGSKDANWMFVGEAPGAEEDRQGLPFVGRAGALLNAMLAAMGLTREEVFIANVLKCRPPGNRNPSEEEVVCCESYLHRQLSLIRPGIIVAMGKFAAQTLSGCHDPVGKLRGQVFTYGPNDTPLIATYHPAYLLRSPLEKRKSWQDLQFADRVLSKATVGRMA